jgi:hypothetical protein
LPWITGFGLTRVSPPTTPTRLQKVQLPIITNEQASSVWPEIAQTDMMAGYKSGGQDACNGDSGGPLVVPVDNEYKLAGLVSWGSSNCNTYGAYTRVSIFESWINSKTGIEISYVPPVPSGDSIVCKGVTTSQYSVGTINAATAYEWQLLPTEAGTIQGNSEQANVTWNQGYLGTATVKLRVTKYNILSYWSALTVHIAEYNSLTFKSNDTIICAGEPVTLRVESKGYNLNYSWFKDGLGVSSASSPELLLKTTNVDSSGVYRCDISGSCGEVLLPEINLTALPETVISAITPDTEAKFGDEVNIEAVADGHNLLYQWEKDEIQISGANSPVYSLVNVNAANTGLYRVVVAGTCGEEISKNVYVYVIDKDNNNGSEISVWPTLVTGEFNVALNNSQTYDLKLFSSTGILIKDKRDCQYKTTLDISGLPRGVYIITVYSNNFRKSVKLIKN